VDEGFVQSVFHGARMGLGSNCGEDTAQKTIGNSNYNALETNLRYVGKRSDSFVAIIAVPINWEHASVIAKTQHNSTSGSLRGGQVDHFPVRLLIDAV
jgi:hypothetical protein